MEDNTYVQNLYTETFSSFGASDAELICFALDEAGLLGPSTLVNGKSARQQAESFYEKRNRVRQNSRLGNLLINENLITKEQLVEALSHHVHHDVPLGESLIQLGFCNPEDVSRVLAKQASLRRGA